MAWEGLKFVTSNGRHTNKNPDGSKGGILGSLDHPKLFGRHIEDVLEEYGPEPDSLKTPRIASVVELNYYQNVVGEVDTFIHYVQGFFGMVREVFGEPGADAETPALDGLKGEAALASTYTGRLDNPHPPFAREDHWIFYRPFDGKTPQELAQEFREMTDKDLFVSSAAGVFDGGWDEKEKAWKGEWKVAVSNKHGD